MRVVIVGGGSAGLFCARGLAGRADVIVIEAGIDPGSPAPDRFLDEYRYPDCDWDYVNADTGAHLVRGKVLGGSSTVNACAAARGQPASFDAWGDGWRWDDVLPAFRAIERDEQFGDRPWHGDAGPIVITRLPKGSLDDAFGAAAVALGHAECADHNEPDSMGVGPWPTNRVDGGRWGTLTGVAPALRGVVEIRASTEVMRLDIRGRRAQGVVVDGPDGEEIVPADVVVVAAGTFGTPEVLWRSGLSDPAIGAGLQDHPWVWLDVNADPDAIAERPVSSSLLRAPVADDPDDEFQVFPFSPRLLNPDLGPTAYRIAAALMSPRSMRRMEPGEGDTSRIHLGHLADQRDVDRLVIAVQAASNIIDLMADAGAATLPPEPWWRGGDLATEVRRRVQSYNHAVGTCGIGRAIDPDLRPRGIGGVVIADASVMPVIPNANTNLASMMIGWRAAELVLAAGD